MKGRIRDYKEFWGLSPNVPFENCDVNPVSGNFLRFLPSWQSSGSRPFEQGSQRSQMFRISLERSLSSSPTSGNSIVVEINSSAHLPHSGKIHLISGSTRHNTVANEIFKEFQEHANNGSLPFRRFPMKAHICESFIQSAHT